MTTEKMIQATGAMCFAAIVIIALLVLGDAETRRMALFAGLLGCTSQYAGQDASRSARLFSIAAAYAGFALIVWAISTI